MTIVQDEARRVHAYETTFSDLEYSVNQEIKQWEKTMNRHFPNYRTLVRSYWGEVYDIEV